jgi:TetR/AcrR family transcriptional regulator, acrAB operon repressor
MVGKTKEQARETRRQIIEAARGVFHHRGVSRASLEMVAEAAGLTRGAIYWHFKDKAELFLAVRENVLFPALEEVDAIIDSDRYADPLDAIEAALVSFFEILDASDSVRAVLETIARRCEHVDEFADVHSEVDGPTTHCLAKLQVAYARAAAAGALRSGLDPGFLASDTWAFAYGLMYRLLAGDADGELSRHLGKMISFHMALRRIGQRQPREDINLMENN